MGFKRRAYHSPALALMIEQEARWPDRPGASLPCVRCGNVHGGEIESCRRVALCVECMRGADAVPTIEAVVSLNPCDECGVFGNQEVVLPGDPEYPAARDAWAVFSAQFTRPPV